MLTLNNFTPTHSDFFPILITRRIAIRAVACHESNIQPYWQWQDRYLKLIYSRITPDQLVWCQQQRAKQLKLHELETKNRNGCIWQNKQTGQFYRGQYPLPHFSPLEENLLLYLIQHVNQRVTLSQLITAGWPEDAHDYVSDDSIYQAMYRLRQKIEITPAQPQYLLNWRGQPEGGYFLLQKGEGL